MAETHQEQPIVPDFNKDILEYLASRVLLKLEGRVKDFRLLLQQEGFVLEGKVTRAARKEKAVLDAVRVINDHGINLPIKANNIEIEEYESVRVDPF